MHIFDSLLGIFLIAQLTAGAETMANDQLYAECARLLGSRNVNLKQYPAAVRLPYWGDVVIPYNVGDNIQPSPTIKTKAVSVVTKFVYRNPVCVVATKKKTYCKKKNGSAVKSGGTLVTKEYFVENAQAKDEEDDTDRRNSLDSTDIYRDEDDDESSTDNAPPHLRGSEASRSQSKAKGPTPKLSRRHVQDMLIEDRLDQLETILPHYVRRRTYETSTITVTKTLSDQRFMATLVAKNCLPQGFQFCATKTKKRKSKLARLTDSEKELFYFG